MPTQSAQAAPNRPYFGTNHRQHRAFAAIIAPNIGTWILNRLAAVKEQARIPARYQIQAAIMIQKRTLAYPE
jgi:hypothetical protein